MSQWIVPAVIGFKLGGKVLKKMFLTSRRKAEYYNFKTHSHVSDDFWQLWKPLKNDEKCFLFLPKSSFYSQNI